MDLLRALLGVALALRVLGAMTSGAVAVTNTNTPVLVELFGSEGCSSCPPADDLLDELLRTQPVKGARVVALAEHVDYWDKLGWRDPFATAAFTARQQHVVDRMHLADGLYTPMMVVDGQVAFVGSDRAKALAAIAEAAARPHAELVALPLPGKPLRVQVEVRSVPPGYGKRLLSLEVASARPRVESHPTAGENAGKTLVHREVAIAFAHTMIDTRHVPVSAEIGPIDVPPATGNIVVTLRTPDGARVLGTTSVPWPPPDGTPRGRHPSR